MKATKDQSNRLKELLKQKTADCKFYAICGNIFLFTSIILGFSLYNMDKKFNESDKILKKRTDQLNYYLDERIKDRHEEIFNLECKRLATISKKPFYIVTEFLSNKPACYYEQVFLYNKKEITEAIRHYELNNMDKK